MSAWTLGWVLSAACATQYWTSSHDNIPLAITAIVAALGCWMTVRTFPRNDKVRAADIPGAQTAESWSRRISGWIATVVWCLVAVIWNLAVFSGIIRAVANGQYLSILIFVPFSLIGGLLLLVLFTAIGVFLDFVFQIKDETAPLVVSTSAPPPPILPKATPSEYSLLPARQFSFKDIPVLGTLALIAFINWFVFFAVSIYLGGDATGTLPSQDGFILTSHGRHTAVSESTWVFSLYYSSATLLLTPGIVSLFVAGVLWKNRKEIKWPKWPARLFLVIFFVAWSYGWYLSIGESFLHSRADWQKLKHSTTTGHPTP